MRQLREEEMLTSRLAAGTVGPDEITQIAAVIAEFHKQTTTDPAIREWGMHGVVSRTVYNTLQLMQTLSVDAGQGPSDEAIGTGLKSFLSENGDLFYRRMDDGCVRDCHGDLRAQNICLDPRYDGGIQVFDCIEFNHEFRYIDVAADLAYLAMDLDLAGRPDLSALLVQAYLTTRPDETFKDILGFYKTYRACVRGNIAMLAANEAEIPEPQRGVHRQTAAMAYDLAKCYSRPHPRPALFITMGLSGTGKSRLARELGGRLPAVVLSSDAVRKEMAGVERTVHLNDYHYSIQEREAVYSELFRRAKSLLEKNLNVILDAAFLSARERDFARDLAASSSGEFWLLECVCPDAVVRQRLVARETEASLSDAGVAVYTQQLKSMQPYVPQECNPASKQFHVLIETDAAPQDYVNKILDRFLGS